ncbi:MAG: MFS transporter [Microcoleus vaginatus WJT46-NPBG5]|jgi:MFS family permease|nr:MFS transporter [Microcoleus vaginatus WJT46-NPBG5]
MLKPLVDFAFVEPLSLSKPEIVETMISDSIVPCEVLSTPDPAGEQKGISKQAIRSSLKASTFDSVFSNIFGAATTGVLLTDFALQLGATSWEIGVLCALPMVMNFLQPMGAYLADRQASRSRYNLLMFGFSRLLWLILALGIGFASWFHADRHLLLQGTLFIVFAANLLSALGSASWLSWMSVLVPHRLRGRYFSFRNSAGSLTTLLGVPLMGMVVSAWAGGTIQGYGVALSVAVIAGLISLGCQCFMADVNPQQQENPQKAETGEEEKTETKNFAALLKDTNFLTFLLYFGFWTFAVNLSSPFFNLYLLKDLGLDVSWVTIFNSFSAGANLLMLLLWGKLADRLGNRPILLLVGILVGVTPLLWVGTGNNPLSLWLWLPLLHALGGGTWAAIDLCSNNIQMEIAPKRQPSTYFAMAAAVAGVTGALGTTVGGFLAEIPAVGGLTGLFALSAVLRLVAIVPLLFVQERRSLSVGQLIRNFLPLKPRMEPILEPISVAGSMIISQNSERH